MATIAEVKERFDKIDLWEIIKSLFRDLESDMEALNKAQLWDGKTIENVDISPTHLNDPYFSSVEKAKNYAEWKQKITPSPNRGFDVPNLYINGKFYSSINVVVESDFILFTANSELGNRVESKFANILGLTEENLFILIQEKILPGVHREVRSILNL